MGEKCRRLIQEGKNPGFIAILLRSKMLKFADKCRLFRIKALLVTIMMQVRPMILCSACMSFFGTALIRRFL